jgi:hypothetical protein
VFWLTRPPYLRWALATLIVVTGLVVELRPAATVPHPFAIHTIEAGAAIDETVVEWKEVPHGLLGTVHLPTTAHRQIPAGEPVPAPSMSEDDIHGIPPGWWGLEVDLPTGARSGMGVRLIGGFGMANGVIVEVREGDFGERSGLIAVPEDSAEAVAIAAMDGALALLVGG